MTHPTRLLEVVDLESLAEVHGGMLDGSLVCVEGIDTPAGSWESWGGDFGLPVEPPSVDANAPGSSDLDAISLAWEGHDQSRNIEDRRAPTDGGEEPALPPLPPLESIMNQGALRAYDNMMSQQSSVDDDYLCSRAYGEMSDFVAQSAAWNAMP